MEDVSPAAGVLVHLAVWMTSGCCVDECVCVSVCTLFVTIITRGINLVFYTVLFLQFSVCCKNKNCIKYFLFKNSLDTLESPAHGIFPCSY